MELINAELIYIFPNVLCKLIFVSRIFFMNKIHPINKEIPPKIMCK